MIPLEEQKAYVRRVGGKAFAMTLRLMKANKQKIIEMMEDGIEEGFEKYGDKSWHLSHAELTQDQFEELRDACNRAAMKLFQGWPT